MLVLMNQMNLKFYYIGLNQKYISHLQGIINCTPFPVEVLPNILMKSSKILFHKVVFSQSSISLFSHSRVFLGT